MVQENGEPEPALLGEVPRDHGNALIASSVLCENGEAQHISIRLPRGCRPFRKEFYNVFARVSLTREGRGGEKKKWGALP